MDPSRQRRNSSLSLLPCTNKRVRQITDFGLFSYHYAIKVKVCSGEAAGEILISALMTISAILRFALLCLGLHTQPLSCNSAISTVIWTFLYLKSFQSLG